MFKYFFILIPLISSASVYEILHRGDYFKIENQRSKIIFHSQYIKEAIRKNKCSSNEIEVFEKELEEKFKTAPSGNKVDRKEDVIKILRDGVAKDFNISAPDVAFFLLLQDRFLSMQVQIKRKCIP